LCYVSRDLDSKKTESENEEMTTTLIITFNEGGLLMGASTVKWTALDPCSGLSESDPRLYTNFEFYEIEIHKHLESI
jgi:hypothetical protein